MVNVTEKCPSCGVITYSWTDGVVDVQEHAIGCSKDKKECFKVGDKVMRKPGTIGPFWPYPADKVFTVAYVGVKSPELFMFDEDLLIPGAVNVFETRFFIKLYKPCSLEAS